MLTLSNSSERQPQRTQHRDAPDVQSNLNSGRDSPLPELAAESEVEAAYAAVGPPREAHSRLSGEASSVDKSQSPVQLEVQRVNRRISHPIGASGKEGAAPVRIHRCSGVWPETFLKPGIPQPDKDLFRVVPFIHESGLGVSEVVAELLPEDVRS